MGSKTVALQITRTVVDKDVPAAKETLEARLDRVRGRVPWAVVSEVATELSKEERDRAFAYLLSTHLCPQSRTSSSTTPVVNSSTFCRKSEACLTVACITIRFARSSAYSISL